MQARDDKLYEKVRSIHETLVMSGKPDQPVSLYAEDYDYLLKRALINEEGFCFGIKVKRWNRRLSSKKI
jgi:hypothetical protein